MLKGSGVPFLPNAPADENDYGVKAWPLIFVDILAKSATELS
jgi:hypothetical protein